MKINEFINYFNNVKAINENEYMALCPAHNDKNPSLSIGYSKNEGQILLHCHAGCKTEDVLHSVGLQLKDLYEAEMYKRDSFTNLRKKIKNDKVLINKLYLNNGDL